jgi:hypothetical protein
VAAASRQASDHRVNAASTANGSTASRTRRIVAACRRAAAHPDRRSGQDSPVGDRGIGAGSGQHRGDRDQQDRLQAVTTNAAPTRVGHRQEGLQQPDRLRRRQRFGGHVGPGDRGDERGQAKMRTRARAFSLMIKDFRHPQITTRSVPALNHQVRRPATNYAMTMGAGRCAYSSPDAQQPRAQKATAGQLPDRRRPLRRHPAVQPTRRDRTVTVR